MIQNERNVDVGTLASITVCLVRDQRYEGTYRALVYVKTVQHITSVPVLKNF